MAKSPIIKVTRNYDIFENQNPENRQVNLAKHRKLGESLKKYGHLPYWPVVCRRNGSGKLKIDDGQHRLQFCKKLGLPVYYIESTHDFDIAAINNTQSVWSLKDYAERWSAEGHEDYKELLSFAEHYHVGLSIAICLLSGFGEYEATCMEAFRNGEFVVKDREYADAFASVYSPMFRLSRNARGKYFQGALAVICRIKGFDPERMVKKANLCIDRLGPSSTQDGYLTDLDAIYNFRVRPAQMFALKTEALKLIAIKKANRKSRGK